MSSKAWDVVWGGASPVKGEQPLPFVRSRSDIMRACLAEAGFPDADVIDGCVCDDPECEWPTVNYMERGGEPMRRAVHKAFLVMGCSATQRCFECWDDYNLGACDHG